MKKVKRRLFFIWNTPVTVFLFQIDVWWLFLGGKAYKGEGAGEEKNSEKRTEEWGGGGKEGRGRRGGDSPNSLSSFLLNCLAMF